MKPEPPKKARKLAILSLISFISTVGIVGGLLAIAYYSYEMSGLGYAAWIIVILPIGAFFTLFFLTMAIIELIKNRKK